MSTGQPGDAAAFFPSAIGTPPNVLEGIGSSPAWKAMKIGHALVYDYDVLGDGQVPDDVVKASLGPLLSGARAGAKHRTPDCTSFFGQERSMSNVQALQAAYSALANNDPSLLFGAMAPDIHWHEAEGNPLADRNPYVGPQAVGEGVFGRLLAAIDGFTATPDRFIDGGDDIIVLGRYGGTMKHSGATLDAPFCHVYRFTGDRITAFQQYTDSAQWARLMP